jgi:hypothetical protein
MVVTMRGLPPAADNFTQIEGLPFRDPRADAKPEVGQKLSPALLGLLSLTQRRAHQVPPPNLHAI